MKSKNCLVIAVLISLLFVFEAFSQNPKEQEVLRNKDKNLIQHLKIKSKSMYVYIFNNGELTGPYGKSLAESCYYDTCGNVIEDYYPGFNGEQYKVNYIYDRNDLLVRTLTSVMGNEPTSFVDYIYDNNRNIIKEIRSYKTDTNKFIDIYKYDENNRLAERNGRIFYYYDSLGNLIYTIEHSLSEPVHNYRRDLKYDNNGRITELMQHNADGSIQFVKQNKYNYNGYLTEEYLNWEDAAYSDHRSLYEYDEKGNKIKIILFEGERKVRNSKYLYDNSGLLAEILNLDQYDNSASVYVFVYEYY